KGKLFQGAEGKLRDLLSKRKCAYPGYVQVSPFFKTEGMGLCFGLRNAARHGEIIILI
ncbi:unnamed protein product, partial [marine sediment metagenome]